MKTLKMVRTAAILMLALSIPGMAGEISTPGFTEDPTVTELAPKPAVPTSPDESVINPADFGLTAVLTTLAALF